MSGHSKEDKNEILRYAKKKTYPILWKMIIHKTATNNFIREAQEIK